MARIRILHPKLDLESGQSLGDHTRAEDHTGNDPAAARHLRLQKRVKVARVAYRDLEPLPFEADRKNAGAIGQFGCQGKPSAEVDVVPLPVPEGKLAIPRAGERELSLADDVAVEEELDWILATLDRPKLLLGE